MHAEAPQCLGKLWENWLEGFLVRRWQGGSSPGIGTETASRTWRLLSKISDVLQVDFLWLLTGRKFSPAVEGDKGALIPVYDLQDFHTNSKILFYKRTLQDVGERGGAFYVGDLDLDNAPEFLPGDICIADPSVQPRPKKMVVARLTDKNLNLMARYIITGRDNKGLPVVTLTPLNDGYPSFSSDKDRFEVLAVVVEHQRNLRNRDT